jgi:hypothetical protein
MTTTTTPTIREPAVGDWRERLALVVDTMREISRQTDPQEMIQVYAARIRPMAESPSAAAA